MEQTLDLFVKVVSKSSQAGGTGSVATGDGSSHLIIGFALIVVLGLLFFAYRKFFAKDCIGNTKGINSLTLSLHKSKIFITILCFVGIVGILIAINFTSNAFAGDNDIVKSDKSVIEAVANDDGTVSADTCSLTNISNCAITISSSAVNTTENAAKISGIDQTQIKINGFEGILFEGNPNGQSFKPVSILPLEANKQTNLSFDLKFANKSVLDSVLGMSVFKISVTVVPDKCTITYHADDKTGGNVPQTQYTSDGEKVIISDSGDLAKAGYAFLNWNTKQDGTGKIFNPGDEYIVTDNLDLYAQWKANDTYSICWDSAGGTEVSGGSSFYTSHDTTIVLPNQAPTKVGYTFDGWMAFSKTEGQPISGWPIIAFKEAPVLNNPSGDVVLVAQWTANWYTVYFNNMGHGEEVKDREVIFDMPYGTLPVLEAEGYVFDGWYLEDTFQTKVESLTHVTTPSNHTLYAKWTKLP